MEWVVGTLIIGGMIAAAYFLGRAHGYDEARHILEMFMYTDDKK